MGGQSVVDRVEREQLADVGLVRDALGKPITREDLARQAIAGVRMGGACVSYSSSKATSAMSARRNLTRSWVEIHRAWASRSPRASRSASCAKMCEDA